ncbi:uncharacterized protein BYT42DRAFT_495398 [Radiomyces spectabilis]|uniref:uncharacterized protein n=1 Tax=Radiomyces spectabilis TaxID=64574 RepID=UPI00221E38BD|nr:uncharacterized protein BYT42DRAFT_495398 [Radiomyces spectabilis]KAI8379554.1 hypothetical protein BYT42DRAFT_495398 [Radiomyces spectabilis]
MSSEDLVYAKEEDNYLLPHGDGRDPQEKYMSYIPHSGFHNQRIALTNALMLAYRLNRTLLVPPVVLGNPIHWRKYDSLESFHRKSTKTHLGHCQGFLDQFGHLNTNSGDEVPLECRSSFRYTSLRWDRLFNMTSVKERVRIRYRDTYARTWLQDKYGLSKDDTYAVKDELLYDYRIADKEDVPIGKYQRDILLSDLQQRPERLISFGSLFGHGRVMTSTKESKELQVFIMKQFVFSPSVLPELFTEANRIIAQLGGPQTYISVHARVGDSIFERYSDRVMAKLWSDLRKYLPLIKSSQTPGGVADAPANACFQSPNSTLAVDPRSRRLLQDRPLVLFMATDAPHPRQHPTLQRFFSTFPCVVTLNDMYDFPSSSLATMVNPSDGVNFGQFFVPFLDGIVAGHAQEFTGSMWSTFSSYIRFLHTQFVE